MHEVTCIRIEKTGEVFMYTFEGQDAYMAIGFLTPANFMVGEKYTPYLQPVGVSRLQNA